MLTEDSVRSTTHKTPNGQDVVDPLSLNLYTYCWNNPVKYSDPTGNNPYILVEQFYYSPAGQQIMQQLQVWADQAGASIQVFIANNMPIVQQLIDQAGQVGPAVYNYFSSGQAGRDISSAANWIGDKASSGYNAVKNWFSGGGGASPGDPNWNGGFKNFRQLKNYLGGSWKRECLASYCRAKSN